MTDSADAYGAIPEFARLHEAARQAAARAYAPYSGYRVGAAALTTTGRLLSGCNVENASYGVTLCAECGVISDLHRSGGGLLMACVCVDAEGTIITPCGRCRQLLAEHAAPEFVLAGPRGTMTITDLLPESFGPHNLREQTP